MLMLQIDRCISQNIFWRGSAFYMGGGQSFVKTPLCTNVFFAGSY